MRSDRLRSGKRPALTEKQRRFVTAFIETLDVEPAALQAGYSKRHAKAVGESLSDILQGLEEDILRILTRLLITEPLARGLTAGLGSFTGGGLGSGGGLEGLISGGFGALANLFPSPVPGLGLGSFNALAPIAAQDVANPLLAGIFQAG
ncbi:MAG TPA: terminase small subunit, partial [Kiloniellales bacterium]